MIQRDYIIGKAMSMFVRQGIKAVRMDDIAQELGVSKRTLYEMFGDKEELLYLCLERYTSLLNDHIAQTGADARNCLEAILTELFEMTRYSETNHRIMGNLQKFYPTVHERLRSEVGRRDTERFKNAIQTCVRQGLLDEKVNIDFALTMLYYMARGVVTRKELILPEGISVREAFFGVVLMFFRGISTSEGMRIIDDFHKSERFTACTDNKTADSLLDDIIKQDIYNNKV